MGGDGHHIFHLRVGSRFKVNQMSAHITGQYRIALFDMLGARMRTVTAESYTQALQIGEARKGAAECHSFAVSLVLFNSLDPNIERYDVRT